MISKSVADVVGPWTDSNFGSGLIERCQNYWTVPAAELPDLMVATFLEQRIAMPLMIEEARRRLAKGEPDGSEFFDGQLSEALEKAK